MTRTPSPVLPTEGASSRDDAAGAEPAGVSRRAVVAGVGGVACAGLLTSCGGGSTALAPATSAPAPSAPSASEGAPSAPSPSADAADALASTSDIPVGGGAVFADQDVVVTQPTSGEFKAFSATCTHQGCKVRDVAAGKIHCPCHNSYFAVADRAVLSGPAKRPLPEKSVSVDGNSIRLA